MFIDDLTLIALFFSTRILERVRNMLFGEVYRSPLNGLTRILLRSSSGFVNVFHIIPLSSSGNNIHCSPESQNVIPHLSCKPSRL